MIGGSSSTRCIQRVFFKVNSATTASEASTNDLDNMFDLVQEHKTYFSQEAGAVFMQEKYQSI